MLYTKDGRRYHPASEDEILAEAARIFEQRHFRRGTIFSPEDAHHYLKYRIGALQHEVFYVVFLDNRHQIIDHMPLFRGTIDGASVHPREVVKEALGRNAAAVVFAHNHPSGIAEPSQADIRITSTLKEALAIVGIRVLDHLIVGTNEINSLARRGEL